MKVGNARGEANRYNALLVANNDDFGLQKLRDAKKGDWAEDDNKPRITSPASKLIDITVYN